MSGSLVVSKRVFCYQAELTSNAELCSKTILRTFFGKYVVRFALQNLILMYAFQLANCCFVFVLSVVSISKLPKTNRIRDSYSR